MKFYRQISIFFCLILAIQVALSAPDCWGRDCKELHVMAPSGLSLRTTPATNAKRILVIPFGETVRNHGIASKKVMIGGIENTWMKVTYNGHTGYAFGAYLSNVKQLESSDINRDVRLEFGGHCDGQINYDPNLHWYGVYWDHEKDIESVVKINPQIYTAENTDPSDMDLVDYWLEDSSVTGINRLMFGSKHPIKPQKNIDNYSPKDGQNLVVSTQSFSLGSITLSIKRSENYTETFWKNPWKSYYTDTPAYELIIKASGRIQVLDIVRRGKAYSENNPETMKYIVEPISLVFAGDLDMDGQTDLVFRLGGEKNGMNVLFLSSYAEEGEILKKVASRGDSYCC